MRVEDECLLEGLLSVGAKKKTEQPPLAPQHIQSVPSPSHSRVPVNGALNAAWSIHTFAMQELIDLRARMVV